MLNPSRSEGAKCVRSELRYWANNSWMWVNVGGEIGKIVVIQCRTLSCSSDYKIIYRTIRINGQMPRTKTWDTAVCTIRAKCHLQFPVMDSLDGWRMHSQDTLLEQEPSLYFYLLVWKAFCFYHRFESFLISLFSSPLFVLLMMFELDTNILDFE
jgi:hypothetical protein